MKCVCHVKISSLSTFIYVLETALHSQGGEGGFRYGSIENTINGSTYKQKLILFPSVVGRSSPKQPDSVR